MVEDVDDSDGGTVIEECSGSEIEGDASGEEGSLFKEVGEALERGGSATGAALDWLQDQRVLGTRRRRRNPSGPGAPSFTLTLPCLSFDSPALHPLGDAQSFSISLPDTTALWEALRNAVRETPGWKGVMRASGEGGLCFPESSGSSRNCKRFSREESHRMVMEGGRRGSGNGKPNYRFTLQLSYHSGLYAEQGMTGHLRIPIGPDTALYSYSFSGGGGGSRMHAGDEEGEAAAMARNWTPTTRSTSSFSFSSSSSSHGHVKQSTPQPLSSPSLKPSKDNMSSSAPPPPPPPPPQKRLEPVSPSRHHHHHHQAPLVSPATLLAAGTPLPRSPLRNRGCVGVVVGLGEEEDEEADTESHGGRGFGVGVGVCLGYKEELPTIGRGLGCRRRRESKKGDRLPSLALALDHDAAGSEAAAAAAAEKNFNNYRDWEEEEEEEDSLQGGMNGADGVSRKNQLPPPLLNLCHPRFHLLPLFLSLSHPPPPAPPLLPPQ